MARPNNEHVAADSVLYAWLSHVRYGALPSCIRGTAWPADIADYARMRLRPRAAHTVNTIDLKI